MFIQEMTQPRGTVAQQRKPQILTTASRQPRRQASGRDSRASNMQGSGAGLPLGFFLALGADFLGLVAGWLGGLSWLSVI